MVWDSQYARRRSDGQIETLEDVIHRRGSDGLDDFANTPVPFVRDVDGRKMTIPEFMRRWNRWSGRENDR